MQQSGSTDRDERPHGQRGAAVAEAEDATEPTSTGDVRESGQASTEPQEPGRGGKIAVYVAAAVLTLGVGFGLTKLIDPPRAAPPSSAIPLPAKSGGVFTEDDDGTGQDSEANILQSTAPGLVHVVSGGQAVGIGLVLTPSGKVLTTYQPSGGAGGLSARYALSGQTFKATVLGTDASAGLALLQLQGGDGRAFATVAVGNSDTLADDTYASRQLSYHVPGQVFDTAVGITGTQKAVVINTGLLVALNETVTLEGKLRTGLMRSRLQSSPATVVGGPLVDLNGRVIGITLGGGGTGLEISGYAMPVNQALAIARQIDAKARHTS